MYCPHVPSSRTGVPLFPSGFQRHMRLYRQRGGPGGLKPHPPLIKVPLTPKALSPSVGGEMDENEDKMPRIT